ncbi:MAG: hypothetical protein ABUT20_27780 [Bacteroidota bacterium]
MKALLLLLIILIGCAGLSAQDSTIVTIKPGYKISEVLNPSDIFYYPQYTSGKVFLRDGSKAIAKMNYNHLTDQMLFIDQKGDTLALADEKNIKLIVVDQDTFYFDDGYMRLIADNGIMKLTEKKTWQVADVRKIGAFNKSTNTVAITSLASYTDRGRAKSYDLLASEDLLIRKESQYYFGDQYNNFGLAGKKKLLQLFPKEHLILENYLKENKVNFENREDLKKIVQFLAQHR